MSSLQPGEVFLAGGGSGGGEPLARIIHKPSAAVPYLPALVASSSLAGPRRITKIRLRSPHSSSLPSLPSAVRSDEVSGQSGLELGLAAEIEAFDLKGRYHACAHPG